MKKRTKSSMNTPQKINFINIPVDKLTMDQTIEVIHQAISEEKSIKHIVINAGKVSMMKNNSELYHDVVSADIINADGQAIVWAAKFLGQALPERVAGIDLMQKLVEQAAKNNHKIFFFGAKEEIVKKVVGIYSEKFSPNIIAGYRNGYFNQNEEEQIALNIAKSGANILFVAISSPKKEHFLEKHKTILKSVNFTMGVGGSFDVVAGKTKRAPKWMQNAGLEWFYRFLQEPKRMWKRYFIGNSIFILMILQAKLTGKSPIKYK